MIGTSEADATGWLSASPHPIALIAFATALAIVIATIVFSSASASKKKKGVAVALHPEEWRRFQLIEKASLSHNVLRLRFSLQSPDTVLGLPIGQHISIQGRDEEGKEFARPYTPVSLDSDVGYVDFVIKIYPEGSMSKFLSNTDEGNFVAMRGPKGRFKHERNMVRSFGMIAGGTGITPMFQVARATLEDSSDKTTISLITANVTADDILLKEELDAFAQKYPGRFSVYYVLNKPPENWTGGVGYVNKDILKAHLPAPADDIKVVYCGPPPMTKAMGALLEELGYKPDMLFKF